jgi:Holliday junction DNA helicase RuvA
MYEYLTGKLIIKTPTYIVIECNGIGYNLSVSLNTYSKLKDEEHGKVYVHHVQREDAQILFGFAEEEEKRMFRHLITVSGVGPGTARMILSSMTPSELQQNIVTGNAPVLQNIKGIGNKSAQRIIVDLKDKITKEAYGGAVTFIADNTAKTEALSALVTLGFNKSMAEKTLDKIMKDSGESITVETLIKSALNSM